MPGEMTVGLTPQQRELVVHASNGVSGEALAKLAGYADGASAGRALRIPIVAAAVRAEIVRVIGIELPALAVNVVRKVLQDDQASHRDKLAAARLAFEASRVIGKSDKPLPGAASSKPLEDMSQGELEAFIAAGAARVGALRTDRTIDAVPNAQSSIGTGNVIPSEPSA